MIILDPKLLREFRTPGPCEVCQHWCRRRVPHHVHTRGAGQLDIRVNLLAVGADFECECHGRIHQGTDPSRADLIGIVAEREGVTVEDIEETIWRYRRLDKDGKALRESAAVADDHDPAESDPLPDREDHAGQGIWFVGRSPVVGRERRF